MFHDYVVKRLKSTCWGEFNFGSFWTSCYHKALNLSYLTTSPIKRWRYRWNDDGDYVREGYDLTFLAEHRWNTETKRVFYDAETQEHFLVERLETRPLAHHNPHARFVG